MRKHKRTLALLLLIKIDPIGARCGAKRATKLPSLIKKHNIQQPFSTFIVPHRAVSICGWLGW